MIIIKALQEVICLIQKRTHVEVEQIESWNTDLRQPKNLHTSAIVTSINKCTKRMDQDFFRKEFLYFIFLIISGLSRSV